MPKDMSEQVFVLQANIQIERENYSKLISSMKELMSRVKKQGSSRSFWSLSPGETITHYDGVDTKRANDCLDPEDTEDGIWCFFEQWGYVFEIGSAGLEFVGGRDPELGQWGSDDHHLFKALAGVASPGSYIRFQDTDNELWGYVYTEDGMQEERGYFEWVTIREDIPTHPLGLSQVHKDRI